jgi:hypothetical protein
MPAIDTGGARIVRKPKKRPVVRVSPDQADRQRSPAQQARDRRTVNRTIAHAEARARVTPDQADRKRSPVQQAKDRAAVAQNVASSRQAYLGKRGRGAGTRQLSKELEGHGALAALSAKLAEKSAQQITHPGSSSPSGFGVLPTTSNGFGQRLAKDLINAPAQAIPSIWVPVSGAVEAVQGHPEKIKQFAHQINTSDPAFNLVAAVADAAKGDIKGAGKRLKATKDLANAHPGFTLLEAMGVRGVAGRGLGATVRGGAKVTGSETLRRIGTTERTPKTLPKTNLVEHRRYSKDIFRKAAQVIQDKQAARRAADLRAAAKKETNPEARAKLKARARKEDPTRIDDKDIQRRVDDHVGVTEDVRRTNQATILSRENKTFKQASKGGPLVSLLTQRIVRPTLESMENYRSDLVKIQGNLKGSRLRANEQLVHDLDQAIEKIKTRKLSVDQLKQIADRYAEHSAVSQAGLTSRGIYDAAESERRAVTPFAIRELGAHRDPEYLKAAEKTAGKTAKQTGKAAARLRGKTLQRVSADKRVTAADIFQQETRPLREPSALQALKDVHEAAAKARGKQIKATRTRAGKATTKAETAAGVHSAAKALRKADPLLIEEKVTTRVPVKVAKGAKPKTKRVTTTQKRKIETPEIIDALKTIHGPNARAGLVSQRPEFETGGGDFFQGADKPKGGEKRRLGGSATTEGGLDASPERLLRQHVRAQALQDAHDSYTSFVSQFARRKGKKIERYTDRQRVTDRVNNLNAEGDIRWRVVRLSPFKSGEAQLRSLLEGAGEDPHVVESETTTNALHGEGDGPWAIVPEAAARQMQQHMDSLSPNVAARGLRSVSSGFRRAVLATSLPWMAGNLAEAGFRSAINRVGPGSFVRGHRISSAIDRLDPEGAQAAKARLLGGGHYAFADRRIHANLDAYTEGLVKDVTSGWRKIATESPARVLPWLWDRWTHHAFNTINKNIEQFFQKGMLGKAAKEQLMPDSFRATSQKAIDQMAEGVIDPNTAAALKSEIDRMYGKYQGFSPSQRFLIANYTPFGAWMRNAAILLVRMAEDHPATTLAATGAVNATEDWRKSQGLDIGSEGAMKAWLQGSIPLPGGAHLRVTRFTPMSLATDPLGTFAGSILPQFNGVLKAFEGKDWTGKDLKTKDGGPPGYGDELKAALSAFADSTIPGLTLAQTVAKKGPKAIPQSAVGYTPNRASGNTKGGFRAPKPTGFDGKSRFGGQGRFDGSSRFSGQSRFK